MLWVWPIDEIVCLSVFILSYREKRKPWKELFQNAKRNYFLMVGLPVIFFLSILVLSFVFSQKACIFYMWKKAFKRQPWIVLVNTDPKQKVFHGTDLTQTAGNEREMVGQTAPFALWPMTNHQTIRQSLS